MAEFFMIVGLVLLVLFLGLMLELTLKPITCRHGVLAHADCRWCKREMDEWYEEEMKAFEEQHNG